ncbi:MAG: radical SAM protein [Candidatus Eisenbacteria sp.]|nr:radical SAM protein [Candidatus Eisenbacteria bacterium]
MRSINTADSQAGAHPSQDEPAFARRIPEHRYQISGGLATRIAWRGLRNILRRRPVLLPFEVTRSCNCSCRHCQLGGTIPDEVQAGPERYRELVEAIQPAASQISGGEPLLRSDILDIVRAIKQSDGLPYLIFVSNAVLLTEDKYLDLKEAGVNQFSVSLDFPDDRHDAFRAYRGLFQHLSTLLPGLAKKYGFGDIVINTAIQRENLPHLMEMIDLARSWGICISFSAYTVLRTGEERLDIKAPKDLAQLRRTLGEIMAAKSRGAPVITPDPVLKRTCEYFERGSLPNCAAGRRSACVMPNGDLVPCAYFPTTAFDTQEEMLREFTSGNECGRCFVSVRAYTEQSVFDLLSGSLRTYLQRRRSRRAYSA